MKEINVKMRLSCLDNPLVTVDGEALKFRKRGDVYECNYLTEKDTVELEISSYSELSSRGWFWWWLLFFVISGFGIFGAKRDRCVNLLFAAKLTLNDRNAVSIGFNHPSGWEKRGRAVEFICDCTAATSANRYEQDGVAKRRRKLTRLAGALSWLGVVAAAIVLLFVLI